MASPLLSSWIVHLREERRFAANSLDAYQRDVSCFLDFLQDHLGETPGIAAFARLEPRDLRAYLAFRRQGADKLSDRSVARALAAIRSFLRFLERRHGLDNPKLALVRGPKLKRSLPRPVSEAAAVSLIQQAHANAPEAWIGARDAALLTLIYATGLRISEALSLRGGDRPLGDALRIAGKGGKQRLVPVLAAAREAVEAYSAACPFDLSADGPLFRAARGGPMTPRMAQTLMEQLRLRLGLPQSATPHALRHAFATHLLSNGGDLRAIQELLGHESLSTTQGYTGVEAKKILIAYRSAHPRA